MPVSSSVSLDRGERLVLAVRSHPWPLIRAALPLPIMALSPLAYIVLDELAPGLRMAIVFGDYLAILGLAFLAYLLKWLAVDLLSWAQRKWFVTDRRIVAQSGWLAIRRRECPLLKVQESDYVRRGLVSSLLDIGDVRVQTLGALGALVMRDIHHPRQVLAAIGANVRAARDDSAQRVGGMPEEVIRQLQAAMGGPSAPTGATPPGPHAAPTQVVQPISPRAAHAQKRLNLLPDEAVVAVTRQHGVVLAARLAPHVTLALVVTAAGALAGSAVWPFAGLALLAIAVWTAWSVVVFRDHEFVLTTERLMELRSTPLMFQMRDIVQLAGVQDVTLEIPSLFGRLTDIGNVVVEVAGPDERVVLSSVGHPATVQKLIFEAINAHQERDTRLDDQRLVDTLCRWFSEYHRLDHGPIS